MGLYVAILKFQATAACHFDNHTLTRTVRSALQLDDWTKLLQKVKFKDMACKDLIAIRSSKNEATALTSLQEALGDQDVKLQSITASLQLTQKETNQIMRWISDVYFKCDHEQVRNALGARYGNSCQWVLHRVDGWLQSSESPVLWLCGTVGEGKSCAVSAVIEHLSPPILTDPDYIVSYFYISQKRNRRSDPVDIFRCILAQMASFNGDDTISATLKAMFDERGRDRFSGGGEPSLDECITLIIEISCCWRRSMFIIDALDECSAPNEVLNGLSDICTKSNSSIKVFFF